MYQEELEFEGVTVPKYHIFQDLKAPNEWQCAWPNHWVRFTIKCPSIEEPLIVFKFALKHASKYVGFIQDNSTAKIAFQCPDDALVFRLAGGDKAWEHIDED